MAKANGKKKKRGAPSRPHLLSRFGNYLKKRRKQRGWSLRELAKRAETAHSNVFQWEKLGKDPRLTELQTLARAFNEPLMDFIGGMQPQASEAAQQ